MMSAARVVLLVVVCALLVSSAWAACTGDSTCSNIEVVSTGGIAASFSFYYTSTGEVCDIFLGTSQITATGITPIPIISATGKATVAGTGVGHNFVTNIDIRLYTSATEYAQIKGDLSPLSATFAYSPLGVSTPVAVQSQSQDTCTGAVTGDPAFRGFLGQKFHIIGGNFTVFNLLSTGSVQLNTRLNQLQDGDAMTRMQMFVMRLGSMKTPFTLPTTESFSHDGPYMAELGLATESGHQLYAQAGGYKLGFNTVTLDGESLPVSEKAVAVGASTDAVTVHRRNSHQLLIETASVQLLFTNSDHFFNLDSALLKPDFDFEQTPMDGALGQTASASNAGARWRQQIEEASRVQSGNLFELTPSSA